MILNPRIPVHRLILSLSQALDYVHQDIADHQQRVAYIAINMARHLDMSKNEILELFCAAALHDIGLIGVENKVRNLCNDSSKQEVWHAEVGYSLLQGNPLFAKSADIIRYQHIPWRHEKAAEHNEQNVPFSSTSTAANIVGGAQLNGRTTWKDNESGKTYAAWQEAQTG